MNLNLHRQASELISQSRDASDEKSKAIQKLQDQLLLLKTAAKKDSWSQELRCQKLIRNNTAGLNTRIHELKKQVKNQNDELKQEKEERETKEKMITDINANKIKELFEMAKELKFKLDLSKDREYLL